MTCATQSASWKLFCVSCTALINLLAVPDTTPLNFGGYYPAAKCRRIGSLALLRGYSYELDLLALDREVGSYEKCYQTLNSAYTGRTTNHQGVAWVRPLSRVLDVLNRPSGRVVDPLSLIVAVTSDASDGGVEGRQQLGSTSNKCDETDSFRSPNSYSGLSSTPSPPEPICAISAPFATTTLRTEHDLNPRTFLGPGSTNIHGSLSTLHSRERLSSCSR